MKVLDLRCDAGHGFEGWFGSESDYEAQRDAGRIECPMCGSTALARLPSAPRLNLSGARAPIASPGDGAATMARGTPAAGTPASTSTSVLPPPDTFEQAVATRLARAVDEILRHTEDVGDRFPEEARRIHYGEVPAKGIRGQATPEERAALQEEGIETVALPIPVPPTRLLQ